MGCLGIMIVIRHSTLRHDTTFSSSRGIYRAEFLGRTLFGVYGSGAHANKVFSRPQPPGTKGVALKVFDKGLDFVEFGGLCGRGYRAREVHTEKREVDRQPPWRREPPEFIDQYDQ